MVPKTPKNYTSVEVEAEKLTSFLKPFYGIDFIQHARYVESQLEHFQDEFYPLSDNSWVQLRQFVLRRYIGGAINLSDAIYTAFTTVPELYQLAADEMFKNSQNWTDPYFRYSWTYGYFGLAAIAEHFSSYSVVTCHKNLQTIVHMNVNSILFQLK
ncbi:hypothetical protein AAFX30_06415 [Vibrio chagasii]|uniref:hypothetical protein n=1 Tax=Vibrio chagasii TaxID=170679 RepID=UPI0038CDBD68